MDPEMQEVSVGQLCTAPASSLAFVALVVGPVFCTLEVLLSPALCPAHLDTLCHHSQGHHPSQEDQDKMD